MPVSALFLGRDSECDEVSTLLRSAGLVTLVGPGGIGKTRLANEVSAAVSGGYDGGVLVSELAGFTDDDDIAGVVSRQLGCDSLDAVRYRSAGKRTLVVLDNCESSLGQAAGVASYLASDDSSISVLATSRMPLQVYGEHVVAVGPLEVPAAVDATTARSNPSVQLFIDRAQRAGAAWELTDTNLQAIAELVARLDGLPLAIELAASRSRMLNPPELVDLLGSQLDLLARPGAPGDRHQSLRTAIRSSYDPLPQRPQLLFRHLAVMSAPFDLDLAHAVAGNDGPAVTTLDQLSELVNASLIEVRQTDNGTRYSMLDSIRAFGLEQLTLAGEQDELADRYVNAVVEFADDVVARALESFSADVLASIRDKFVHLSNAIAWCVAHDDTPERPYRLFIPLYGPTGARTEVATLAERVLAAWTEAAPLEAEAVAVMGIATLLSGNAPRAEQLARVALDHPDATDLALMIAHRTLAIMAAQQAETEAAMEHFEAAIELADPISASFARELKISWAAAVIDPGASAQILELLGVVSGEAEDNAETVNVFWSRVVSAFHHLQLDDQPAALHAAEQAMATADKTGFPWSIGAGHRMMAQVLALHDGWSAARPHFRAALDQTIETGDIEGSAVTLRSAAGAALRLGDRHVAEALWATVPVSRGLPLIQSPFRAEEEELDTALGTSEPMSVQDSVATARLLLGPPPAAIGGRQQPTPAAPPAGPTPMAAQNTVVCFGDYELDFALAELRQHGDRVHMEPQVFDVLALLVQRRGTLVTKNDLLDEVWGDRFVSESALTSRIKAARKATGDSGTKQQVIRTVHGKGYTFAAEVDEPGLGPSGGRPSA